MRGAFGPNLNATHQQNAQTAQDWARAEQRRHTLCASDRLPANPLASVAQQWAMNPEEWAKASATYAQAYNQMLANQQQQMPNAPLNPSLFHQQMAAALQMVHQQNQQHQAFAANPNLAANSALMGIMGMRNGLIDYSRMMKIPTSRESLKTFIKIKKHLKSNTYL